MNVLRTLYICPSFEWGSFFISCLFLFFLLFAALLEQRECLSAVLEMAHAGLWCISVSMNLDLNSNENLFQCHRYLALRSNCISEVCVLYLVQLLWISQTLAILSKLSLRNTLRSESFWYVLLLEEKMLSYVAWRWNEVEISALPHPESVKIVRLERQLAEESAELILSSSCCNTTSPIRLRSFLLSCFFYCCFYSWGLMFVRVSPAGSQEAVGWLCSPVSTLLLCSQKLLQIWSSTKPPNSAGKSTWEQIKALRCSFREQAQFSRFWRARCLWTLEADIFLNCSIPFILFLWLFLS